MGGPSNLSRETWALDRLRSLFYFILITATMSCNHVTGSPALLQTSLRLTERQLETFHAGCLSYCVLTHLENCEKGTGSIIPSILAPSHGHTQHYNSPTLSSSPETSQKAEKKKYNCFWNLVNLTQNDGLYIYKYILLDFLSIQINTFNLPNTSWPNDWMSYNGWQMVL